MYTSGNYTVEQQRCADAGLVELELWACFNVEVASGGTTHSDM
jgi:hypothetical protein